MNTPNRFELYTLKDGESRIEVHNETRIPNAATITVRKMDHTMGNLLRAELLKDEKNVLFAGYKVPHPLEPYFLLKIQTTGEITPRDAFHQACVRLVGVVNDLSAKFAREFELKESDEAAGVAGGGGAGGLGGGVGPEAYGDGGAGGARGLSDYLDLMGA